MATNPTWSTKPFGEVIRSFDSSRVPIKESERQPGPYPYYGASGIVDHIDRHVFDGEYLLIAEDGENLRSRQTPIAFLARGRFWVNNHAHVVQANSENVTRYLLYAVRFADMHSFLTGSTMPKLTAANLSRVPVRIPVKNVQQAIAHILGTIDDKIDLLRCMNQTLEETARALFNSWFARSLGTNAEYSPVQTLVDARVLQIGDGYRAKNSEMASEGIPFARAGNVNNGFHFGDEDLLGEDAIRSAGDKVSKPWDVVFTSKGTVGRFAVVYPTTRRFAYSPQLCFWRSLNHERLNPIFLLCWMRSRAFLDQVATVSGQTDMALYVNLRDQRRMHIALPSPTAQRELELSVRPIVERVEINESQVATLAEARDTLLPKLLSGSLRIPNVERFLSSEVRS